MSQGTPHLTFADSPDLHEKTEVSSVVFCPGLNETTVSVHLGLSAFAQKFKK